MPVGPFAALRRVGLALPAALLTGLLLSPGRPAAQTAGVQKSLQYNVNVTLKLVQVYVTDKDGLPVADMKPEEFEVTDNGQKVPVTQFEKHFLGQAVETAGGGPGPRMSRKFFLVFDFGFVDPRGVLKAKTAGLQFIDAKLRPGDEVGLLTYSSFRGLILHEYLTTDHAKVRRIVEGLGLKHVVGRAENLSDYIYAADVAERVAAPGERLSPEEDFFQRQTLLRTGQEVDDGARRGYADRARRLVESLDNFARVLRYIPGYKNIILFSGGLARQILYGKTGGGTFEAWASPEELAAQMSKYDSAQADSGLRGDFTEMLDQFKASNAPVYALDVSRGRKEADVAYNEGTNQTVHELEGADSLRQFASATGGRFYANTMDFGKIMDSIQNITGAYYVLGYSVSEKWDGKFHKIKVRVRRRGCDVMAQGGYFSPKPFKDYTSLEKLLHVTDLALSEVPQLQVPAEVPVAAIAVTVKGSPGIAAFARTSRARDSDVLGKKAEAYLLLLDESGEVSLVKRFKLSLPDDKAGKETFFPSFLLAVKPGRYTCRLVLRNMETGRGARGSATLVVPGPSRAPLVLDPVLLLTPDPRSLDLAGSPEGRLSDLFRYDANSYAPLVGEVPAGLTKIFAALRCSSDVPEPEFRVSASLREEGAAAPAAVPVSVIENSHDGPTSWLLADVGTGELRPGRYSLRIELSDASGGGTAASVADLVVK